MPEFKSTAANDAADGMTDFCRGYIMAIYFTETGDGDQPDSEIELSAEARKMAYLDCLSFQSDNANALAAAYACTGYSEGRAGHDFWLTRNGHGAGFWDRDELEEVPGLGERLSEAAKNMGGCDAYAGDNGLLYLA